MVADACNASYSGGGDRRIMVQGQPMQKNKLGMMVRAHNLATWEAEERGSKSKGWPLAKVRDPI
jgi:hypothetical protein